MPDDEFFPDLFVPWDVITSREIAAFEIALNEAREEAAMQRFLEGLPRMLVQPISGGRDAWVIPKKRLGSEHETDFVIAQKASGGLEWYAVELERPQAIMFTKKGDPSATLTHALRQISDWRDWLSHNRDYAARPRERSGLGLIDIDPELEGLVIMGRDSDIDESTTARRRRLARANRVQIETYDWLLSEAKERFQRYMALDRERRRRDVLRAANEISDWVRISELSEAAVGGPILEKYLTNIDQADPKTAKWKWVAASSLTSDIPSKFDDFIASAEQILGEVGSRLREKIYDKSHDYVTLTASGVINPAQAEKIVQAGKDSQIKYLLLALVYAV